MKSRMSIAVLAALFVLSVSVAAYAERGGCCGGGGGPAVWNELSPEQKQQASAMRTEFMKKQEAVRSQMAQKRIELMELASKDKPDEQAIEKKRQEMWALQDQARDERRAMGTKFRALLTPEQRQKLGPVGMGMGFGRGAGGGGFGAGCGAGNGRGCGGPGFSSTM
jgi:Spy/CpxP family protein refolding chaperone